MHWIDLFLIQTNTDNKYTLLLQTGQEVFILFFKCHLERIFKIYISSLFPNLSPRSFMTGHHQGQSQAKPQPCGPCMFLVDFFIFFQFRVRCLVGWWLYWGSFLYINLCTWLLMCEFILSDQKKK